MADVQLGVTFQGETAQEAAAMAADAMDAVIAALLAADVAEADIQTTQLSLDPIYDYEGEQPQSPGLASHQHRQRHLA